MAVGHSWNSHISLYFMPFGGDSTRNEVDIAEKELIHDYNSDHNLNC
jgi:hypothetical protein